MRDDEGPGPKAPYGRRGPASASRAAICRRTPVPGHHGRIRARPAGRSVSSGGGGVVLPGLQSGKGVALPPPPPLRTGLASFPASGSSLSQRPLERTRSHRGEAATTALEILVPGRVQRVGVSPNADVTPNVDVGGLEDPDLPLPPRTLDVGPAEQPLTAAASVEVLPPYPLGALPRVPSTGPAPKRLPDLVIHGREAATAHHVPVVHGPTPNDGVEPDDQVVRQRAALLSRIMPRTFAKKAWTLALDGVINSTPRYLRTFWPRKSKPTSRCVMTVFGGDSSSPRSARNRSTSGRTWSVENLAAWRR